MARGRRDLCRLTHQILEELALASPEQGMPLRRLVLDRLEVERVTEGIPAWAQEHEADLTQAVIDLLAAEVNAARQAIRTIDRVFCQGEVRPLEQEA